MTDTIIDLSHFNNDGRVPDFKALKDAGIQAVIHKASQGAVFVDPSFRLRAQQAKGAGLLLGAYHFGTGELAATQAHLFLTAVAPLMPDCLLVLDLERNIGGSGVSMSIEAAQAFVACCYAITKRYPVLYAGDYLREILGTVIAQGTPPVPALGVLANCPLWLADYRTTNVVIRGWSTWTMWQYTNSAALPGITGLVDRTQFNGTADELQKFWNPTQGAIVS